jgi:hypothetical protein
MGLCSRIFLTGTTCTSSSTACLGRSVVRSMSKEGVNSGTNSDSGTEDSVDSRICVVLQEMKEKPIKMSVKYFIPPRLTLSVQFLNTLAVNITPTITFTYDEC